MLTNDKVLWTRDWLPASRRNEKGFCTGPARRTFTPNCPPRFGMGWMPVAYPWEIKQTLRTQKKMLQSKHLGDNWKKGIWLSWQDWEQRGWMHLNFKSSSQQSPGQIAKTGRAPSSTALGPKTWKKGGWNLNDWCMGGFSVSMFRLFPSEYIRDSIDDFRLYILYTSHFLMTQESDWNCGKAHLVWAKLF